MVATLYRRVIFLDIDGVLNSWRTCIGLGGFPHNVGEADLKLFDHAAVGLMRKAAKKCEAEFVLSSSWRYIHNWEDIGRALELPIVDRTPKSPDNRIRGLEINAWLSAHPNVERYAIVDDNSDMLPDQKQFFVQTEHDEGFLWRDYVRLLAIFGEEP